MSVQYAPEGLRERNKRKRIDRILTATRILLRERPGALPRMEEIAARAEVSPATVFNLVGPREKVLAALANEALRELDVWIANEPEMSDPRVRVQQIVRATVGIVCADRHVYRAVLSRWHESAGLLRNDPARQIRASLMQAAELGMLGGADPVAMADLLTTGCIGAVLQWAAGLIDDDELAGRCELFGELVFARA